MGSTVSCARESFVGIITSIYKMSFWARVCSQVIQSVVIVEGDFLVQAIVRSAYNSWGRNKRLVNYITRHVPNEL